MTEFIAKSGAKIVVNIAPWQDAKRLKAAIQRECAKAGLKMDLQADVSTLVSAVLAVDSSDEVDAALYPCLARCTRNGAKITMNTFDDKEGRGDYYEIVMACIDENCRPLVESLLSVLPPGLVAMAKKQAELSQKSE